jgi:hypothetical protein
MKPRLLQRAPESQGRLLPILEHRTGDRRIILIPFRAVIGGRGKDR